jgi:hypothetical protein
MDQFNNHPLYRRHDLDSAMGSLWEFYKKRFLTLFIFSFLVSLFTQYASSMIDIKDLQQTTDPMLLLEKMKAYVLPFSIMLLINFIFSTILQHYVLYNPVDSENTIFVSIYKSLIYLIPYLIVMILLAFFGTIAIVLGVFVFIVGMFFAMLYVMTIYMLILPIMMVEGINIGNVIKRAFVLTHRNFWSNIGWVSVFIIIVLVISVILSGVIMIPFTGSFLKALFNPEEAGAIIEVTKNPVFIVLSALASGLTGPLMPIFATILYFNGKARDNEQKVTQVANEEPGKLRVEDLYAKPYSDDHPDNPENRKNSL